MTVLNLQVGASNEDASETASGAISISDLTSGFGSFSRNSYDFGIRFSGVSGLSGATINAGTVLTFRATATDSGSFIGNWFADDQAAPPVFTTAAFDITSRTPTEATCEGDSTDFGNWTSGGDETFTGDGVNTIATIIQELADSYDPSTIVLFWLYVSGSGERIARMWDGDNALAPKLDVDYTAATGDTTATPDPVAIPIATPVPSIAFSTVTATPSPTTISMQTPAASISLGTLTVTPDAVAIPIAVVDAPTIALGTFTATPDPIAIPIELPIPQAISGSSPTTLTPDAVAIPIETPVPTTVLGVFTATPEAVAMPFVLPAPKANVQATPDPVAIPLSLPVPSISLGTLTATPDPVAIVIVLTTPSILGGGVQFTPWGQVKRLIDPSEYATGTVFLIEVGMFTNSAVVPVRARLFNVTDGLFVAGSAITGTATAYEVLRSGTFSLSSGLKKYRLEFGGEVGGTYFFQGGDVHPVSS